ncbi:hypothetical protein [Streptomyces resistomycificus]|uniref:Regulatory protein n=1 Tax=Streptomyces resistomycificus TaxID=67356 RepID=A0A0L8LX13_9ACTN|nr:hypothetical protein [Streptomyces resistomycificus]KOG42620.1 hypothetical protein ADK37_04835 [Streptomyces resistomycificus]KUN92773.1 hypothetical protein AQJ84_31940 [Streptomyces resistomycificus]
MSENAVATELTSQYTAQVTADLERNAKEQERIGGEIAALQEQLAALQRDHTVLVSIRDAIGTAPAPAEPAAPAKAVTVPAARKKSTSQSGGKQARAKKSAPAPRRGSTKKPAAKKSENKAENASTAQPTLVDLVRRHLGEQSEPRSAAEICTALGQAHPDRTIKATVVRTTLEGLVARNQAHRSKQGSSVFYNAPDASEQATKPQAEKQTA